MHQEFPTHTAVIAWHLGDEFEIYEGQVRNYWYEIMSYPTVWFDGVVKKGGGGIPMYPFYLPIYQERMAVPSNFNIEMEISNTDATDYNVSTTVEVLEGVNTENLALFVVLTESGIEFPGLDDQNFMARAIYPDAMGLTVDFSTQTTQVFNTIITLEEENVFENCEVVVFIQNMDTREIYQGTSLMMTDIVGVEKTIEHHQVEVYPNPIRDIVNIKSRGEIKRISVYNNVGQLVCEKSANVKHYRLSTSEFDSGLYFIKIETISGEMITKVSVIK